MSSNRRNEGGSSSSASFQVALQVTALLDLRRRSEAELNGSKRVWVMLSFVNFVGPIAYFLAGRRRRDVGTAVGSSK